MVRSFLFVCSSSLSFVCLSVYVCVCVCASACLLFLLCSSPSLFGGSFVRLCVFIFSPVRLSVPSPGRPFVPPSFFPRLLGLLVRLCLFTLSSIRSSPFYFVPSSICWFVHSLFFPRLPTLSFPTRFQPCTVSSSQSLCPAVTRYKIRSGQTVAYNIFSRFITLHSFTCLTLP